jgi:hypothetical protein
MGPHTLCVGQDNRLAEHKTITARVVLDVVTIDHVLKEVSSVQEGTR